MKTALASPLCVIGGWLCAKSCKNIIDSIPLRYYSTRSPKVVDTADSVTPLLRQALTPPQILRETAICQFIPSIAVESFLDPPQKYLLNGDPIMAEERIKIVEERLTRLEAALTQRTSAGPGTGGTGGTGFPPPGTVSDPAPWAGQWQFIPRQISPVVDPAPWWLGGWTRPRWPTPVVDPGSFPTPVVDPAPWPHPIVDPAVFAQANLAATLGRIGVTGGDPPPPDISRLNVSQLEATIHSIAADRARLDAMESMVKKQIDVLKKQQPG